jgi:acetyl esterase
LSPVTVRRRTRHALERTALAAGLSLPEGAQRALAGRPVRVDGNTLATDVQLMLRLQRLARFKGAEELPLAEGRQQLRVTTEHTAGTQPVGAVRSVTVADLPARLYTPSTPAGAGATEAGPLLVFFHGGGFWCGDLDTHDAACRFLAETSGGRLLSLAYPLGPEHRFPAAHDAAAAAYAWAVEHASELGADPARIGVGGDSAGGNLAAGAAIEAARHGWPCAVQLLVYPSTRLRGETRSFGLFSEGFYLTRGFMDRAELYAADVPSDDPRLSPMHAELPQGLAPALVYTAGFDPLRDEGEAYADRLRAAGTEVALTRFDDQIHGFLNVVGVGRTSRAANRQIARELAAALT